ncbi:tetratricopeptide repeat protein [Fibrella aestuarina BUZ 2]|uniref:Tetratricopeptide repeat protein n=1 Tax=Fibrella aestuarina BUZ 2 TaxID=1166018 RepID=I0K4K2_9BACT|nr:tetratricopeptide repeat protein [Fibrella aestuarina]CCG99055.1 tetratricopeptide repeat protein [Fibrella aestuarina BUZ 2]
MWGWLLLPALAHAQARTPVMVKVPRSATKPAGSATKTPPVAESAVAHLAQPVATPKQEATIVREVDARILPLFGERSKSAQQIEDEIRFLNECDQNFTSREEASQFFAARGWEYVSEAQLDTAAYRFNLANLLNDKNGDAFWGLGVVCYQRNQLSDAINMLKRGAALADTNAVLLTDLATVELEYYQAKHDTTSLTEARDHLQKAIFLNPSHATAFARLSQISYHRAEYRNAWAYLHKAYKLDLASIDLGYIQELLAKEPDPIGLFK